VKWLRDLFTEADGKSFDVTVVMGVGSLLVAFAMVGYSVFALHKDFDIVQFATGVTAIIAGTGAAARLKPQAPTGIT
jgi:hypothetical protein